MKDCVKLISLEDILKAECLKTEDVINIIEKNLKDFYDNKIILPEKSSQIFNEETQNRINCMPSTLIEKKVSGVKWISVFPQNPAKYNMSNVSGVIVLSEIEKGLPFAVIEASLITAVRTAAVGAMASKYLAKKKSEVYCAIGAGEQAKMHFRLFKQLHPEISVCKVASRTLKSEKAFVDFFSKKYPDVVFIPCNSDFEKASTDADIIVTAVSCQEPLLKAKTIKKGSFYCHVGGWEDEEEVALMADKIVCDHWESVKHRSQTICKLYKEGKLKDSDIYADIAEILIGKKPARENEEEFIYFNSVGLSFIDVAIAYSVYEKIVEKGLGKDWIIRQNDFSVFF